MPGGSITGTIDGTTVSAPDIQELSETMFDAAGISSEDRQAYYQAFYQYILLYYLLLIFSLVYIIIKVPTDIALTSRISDSLVFH